MAGCVRTAVGRERHIRVYEETFGLARGGGESRSVGSNALDTAWRKWNLRGHTHTHTHTHERTQSPPGQTAGLDTWQRCAAAASRHCEDPVIRLQWISSHEYVNGWKWNPNSWKAAGSVVIGLKHFLVFVNAGYTEKLIGVNYLMLTPLGRNRSITWERWTGRVLGRSDMLSEQSRYGQGTGIN